MIEARGRNGWFTLRVARVKHGRQGAYVECESSRVSMTPPIIFQGDRVDLLSLFESITASLRSAFDMEVEV